MAERNALSVIHTDASSEMQWWTVAKEQAAMLVKTGFLPTSIKTVEQCVAIMLKGRELSVPSMYALSNIAVINGKPTCGAELMLALVHRDHGRDAIRVKFSSNEKCTVEWKEWGGVNEYSFTIQDAKNADLAGKPGPWKQYPAAMLRARAISAACRMAFPGSIAGMYTPEELGAVVTVREDGSVEVVDDPRHADYISNAKATPTPIKPIVEVVDQREAGSGVPLRDAKKALWDIAQAKGLDKGLLDDYAREMCGTAPADMALTGILQLTQKLKHEDKDALLDRMTNRPSGDTSTVDTDMFPDVEFGNESPDRFRN